MSLLASGHSSRYDNFCQEESKKIMDALKDGWFKKQNNIKQISFEVLVSFTLDGTNRLIVPLRQVMASIDEFEGTNNDKTL